MTNEYDRYPTFGITTAQGGFRIMPHSLLKIYLIPRSLEPGVARRNPIIALSWPSGGIAHSELFTA
ncbi:hypothetical protein FS842_000543 [Serendipita sp. 407]|nr:hypothetical protein FS842_000543 [Serendipita sp. 407]